MRFALWSSTTIPAGETPPTEFRVFASGWNDSTKGRVLFDAEAAEEVMRDYAARGVDIMIDLEHLSLDQESRSFDPDARGWAKLEMRGGELWAVDVRWTPDGQRRLSEKAQRYISPAFYVDTETRRPTSVSNIGLVAMPATHGAPALVAASARRMSRRGIGRGAKAPREWSMAGISIEQLPAVAEALGMGADASLEDVMAALRAIVMAADGEPSATEETPPEPESMAAVESSTEDDDEEDKAEAMAATARLLRLTGRSTLSASLDEVEQWRGSHVKLEAEQKKLAAERAALELGERRKLVAELVAFGAELPATAWADPTQPAERLKLSRRLADEPIAELRARHAVWAKSKGGKAPSTPRSPSAPAADGGGMSFQTPRGLVTLTARELAYCERAGAKPEAYALNKAAQLAARGEI